MEAPGKLGLELARRTQKLTAPDWSVRLALSGLLQSLATSHCSHVALSSKLQHPAKWLDGREEERFLVSSLAWLAPEMGSPRTVKQTKNLTLSKDASPS